MGSEMGLDRILRKPELLEVVGVSIATVYRWVGDGSFPAPVKLGPNSTGWRESAVREWLDSRERTVEVPDGDTSRETEDHCRGAAQPPGRGEPSDGSR
jgi:prophage regulatory protein